MSADSANGAWREKLVNKPSLKRLAFPPAHLHCFQAKKEHIPLRAGYIWVLQPIADFVVIPPSRSCNQTRGRGNSPEHETAFSLLLLIIWLLWSDSAVILWFFSAVLCPDSCILIYLSDIWEFAEIIQPTIKVDYSSKHISQYAASCVFLYGKYCANVFHLFMFCKENEK